jgi:hypothetical protein
VLSDSTDLIASAGELFMISSTLAEPEIHRALPQAMAIERVASRSVPFDIEALRGDGEEDYVAWLSAERGLGRNKSGLVHNIAIYRVTHKGSATGGAQS